MVLVLLLESPGEREGFVFVFEQRVALVHLSFEAHAHLAVLLPVRRLVSNILYNRCIESSLGVEAVSELRVTS